VDERGRLYLKIEVIEKGKVIQAKDVYALYEYFYTFRKLWGARLAGRG
jgi:hypothetical protein